MNIKLTISVTSRNGWVDHYEIDGSTLLYAITALSSFAFIGVLLAWRG